MSGGSQARVSERSDGEAPTPIRGIGLGLVFLVLGGTLVVGHAIKVPCVWEGWDDGRPFTLVCYTDLIPLLGSEQLTGGRLPYLDACNVAPESTCDEYPVLTMWTMRFAAWASGPDDVRFFYANAALMWLAAFWIAVWLYLMVGTRALYFAAAPTLVLAATNNWDLLAVALATAGTLAYLRRRDVWSGVLLGLGAAAKLYPALLVVAFVAGRFRGREPDRGIHLAWAAAGAWIAVNLPFALAGTAGWLEFFQNSASRSASWNSLWDVACRQVSGTGCANTRLINVASAAMFAVWVGAVWNLKARRDPGFARWTLGFPILVVFLLTNKVYSPQFSLWLLPWFALALPHLRLFLAFEAADVIVFVSEFAWIGSFNGVHGGLTELPDGLFQIAVVMRAIVLILCVIAWTRRREPAPTLALPFERTESIAPAVRV
ncbi:MAG: glycosyltransferase 87 family protein [Actinomycetota bacterium]